MKVKSMRGKILDITAFIAAHGDRPALGNAKMNARGDIIGFGGKVVKTNEQIMSDYNRANPKAVSKQVALKNIQSEIFNNAVSPAEATKQAKAAVETGRKRKLVDPD